MLLDYSHDLKLLRHNLARLLISFIIHTLEHFVWRLAVANLLLMVFDFLRKSDLKRIGVFAVLGGARKAFGKEPLIAGDFIFVAFSFCLI